MSPPLLFAALPDWLTSAGPWMALGLTTLVLIVALRARWKRTPLLTRCVIFSIYAHLLFATIAYTTNFVAWNGNGFGSGQGSDEVRVRLTGEPSESESEERSLETPLVEQPWEPIGDLPKELALVSSSSTTGKPEDSPATAEREPSLPRLPELPPVKSPERVTTSSPFASVAEVLAEVAPRYADQVASDIAPQQPSPGPSAVQAIREPARSSSAASSSSSQSTVPDLYRLRFSSDRNGVVESGGGNPDTEAAVNAALTWLVANQEADGSWSAARHEGGRGTPQQGQQRGDTGADADSGVTALAVLALLGSGHTHLEGKHRESVQHALEYLLSIQRTNGSLAGDAKLFASMYCHGMVTLALAESLAITGDPRLKSGVERAVDFTVRAQHSGGGWRYQPGDVGDMSQFGWQVMALKSAELAGIKTPEATRQRAARFLETVSSGRNGGLASYRAKERPSRTMTAEALLCRHLLEGTPRPEICREATEFLLQELPTQGTPNVYYWYYGTLALRTSAGSAWEQWNESLQKQLLTSQRSDARLAGSWDPDRTWGGYGGRVYQTALSALCLESYYRYDHTVLLESPAVLRR
jgi:hypothetical protein